MFHRSDCERARSPEFHFLTAFDCTSSLLQPGDSRRHTPPQSESTPFTRTCLWSSCSSDRSCLLGCSCRVGGEVSRVSRVRSSECGERDEPAFQLIFCSTTRQQQQLPSTFVHLEVPPPSLWDSLHLLCVHDDGVDILPMRTRGGAHPRAWVGTRDSPSRLTPTIVTEPCYSSKPRTFRRALLFLASSAE